MDRFPADIVVVDLDSGKITLPRGTVLPEIPEPERQHLKNHFLQV